jgi:nucleotide-binding universal stress UspA family protein
MKHPIERILVYVDGSEESITAAQYGILLAASTNAEFLAAYVVNTRALEDLVRSRIFLEAEQQEYQQDIEADADRYLNHIRDLAHKKSVPAEMIKRTGTPHQVIKQIIEERSVDLLVIGELSRIRSRRDELYSESERAMRRAPCSVLIVKDDDRVWDLFESM